MKYSVETHNNHTFRIQKFSSLTDLTTHLETEQYNKNFTNSYSRSSIHGDKYFTNTSSYKEALTLLKEGWTDKSMELSKKLPVKATPSTQQGSRAQYDMVGFQASVPRYLQGIPTSMINRKPVQQKQKIITLNRAISFSARWSADKIEQEGIKALQIVQALEAQGYRVKLNIIHLSKVGKEVAVAIVPLKRPEERLSLAKIAFPLVHPSMLRRIMFRWTEVFTELQEDYSPGYGFEVNEMISFLLKKGEHLLPSEIKDIDKYIEGL